MGGEVKDENLISNKDNKRYLFHGDNLTLINLFDIKFKLRSCISVSPKLNDFVDFERKVRKAALNLEGRAESRARV